MVLQYVNWYVLDRRGSLKISLIRLYYPIRGCSMSWWQFDQRTLDSTFLLVKSICCIYLPRYELSLFHIDMQICLSDLQCLHRLQNLCTDTSNLRGRCANTRGTHVAAKGLENMSIWHSPYGATWGVETFSLEVQYSVWWIAENTGMGTHLHSFKSDFCAKAEIGIMWHMFRKSLGMWFFLMYLTWNSHMMPRAGCASRFLSASEMMTGDGFALNARICEPGETSGVCSMLYTIELTSCSWLVLVSL